MLGFQALFVGSVKGSRRFSTTEKIGGNRTMLLRETIELPGPAIFARRSKRKLRKAALGRRVDACAEGTLKLVIAKAMTKLDVGVAGVERSPPTKLSSAVARGRF